MQSPGPSRSLTAHIGRFYVPVQVKWAGDKYQAGTLSPAYMGSLECAGDRCRTDKIRKAYNVASSRISSMLVRKIEEWTEWWAAREQCEREPPEGKSIARAPLLLRLCVQLLQIRY